MLRMITRSFLLALTVVSFALPAIAQTPHPHYLHALSDLRLARALLDQPAEHNVMVDQSHAIGAINRALDELSRASINDGVDPRAFRAPAADTQLDQRGRLSKVQALLNAAFRDLSYAEDNMAALGWRNAALQQVQAAKGLVNKAMRDKYRDSMMAQ